MLLQFSVSNFLSFDDEVTLNMSPAKSRVMKEHVMTDERGKTTSALPIAAIYGANASGKSNLVKAIGVVRDLVLGGTRPEQDIKVTPNRLGKGTEGKPSRFELVFKYDGVVYTYGFLATRRQIDEEWLFARYTSQESRVFERVSDDGRTRVEYGPKLKGSVDKVAFLDYVAEGTRVNQLFLTEANEKNIALIKPVVVWFRDCLTLIHPYSVYGSLSLRVEEDETFTRFLSGFLRIADTGIEEVYCKRERLVPEKHLSQLSPEERESMLARLETGPAKQLFIYDSYAAERTAAIRKDENGDTFFLELRTWHRGKDGGRVDFDTACESDGTRRLMHLAPMLLDTSDGERVFVIDELNRSLHPHLSRFFIQEVIAGASRRNRGPQFIFTTHDTNLLDRRLLRRDEIWFMGKDNGGPSQLRSLAEYKLSEGLNYENGYLKGRFGAIPYVGDPSELLK